MKIKINVEPKTNIQIRINFVYVQLTKLTINQDIHNILNHYSLI